MTVLALLVGSAATADSQVPAALFEGLNEQQLEVAVRGLKGAGPTACTDGLDCLLVSLRNVRIANAMAKEDSTAEQISVAIGLPPEPATAEQKEAFVIVNPTTAPSRGNANAPVTIVTWLDYQCPFSSRLWATIRQLEKEYQGKVRVVVRHRPLPFHYEARRMALMGLVANQRGAFWRFHNAVFASSHPDAKTALALAPSLELTEAQLVAEARKPEYEEQLQADQREAERVGANGTPTSFINGWRLEGAQPIENWREAIDKALAATRPGKLKE